MILMNVTAEWTDKTKAALQDYAYGFLRASGGITPQDYREATLEEREALTSASLVIDAERAILAVFAKEAPGKLLAEIEACEVEGLDLEERRKRLLVSASRRAVGSSGKVEVVEK